MTAGEATAHARALVLRGRCPACAEPLEPRSLFGSAPCARCDASVDASVGGGALAAAIEARGRRRLLGLALSVGLAQLLLGWLPLVGALALVLAAAGIRVLILQPTSALLSPRRRVLTRWTARLLMATAVAGTVIAIEVLTLLPVIGLPIKALLGAAEVALAAWTVTAYVHWQLRREAAGQAIEAWEWAILAAAVALLLASVVALALVFVALASAFDSLAGWLR